MVKVPTRFKKITAAFDDVARARLCESSGSEHSAAESNSDADLSDLVDSFLQMTDDRNNDVVVGFKDIVEGREDRDGTVESELGCYNDNCMEAQNKEILMTLISDQDASKQMILQVMEMARCNAGISSSQRRTMSFLRHKGLEAGLCKSRWEKSGRRPAGEYEYIDVIVSKTRYIVEVSIANAFTIARPTNSYASLLEMLPQVIVCKENELKQLVRIMCNGMRESMKKREIQVSPWRRNGYMQSKWFGSYKRTTNPASTSSSIKVSHGGGVSLAEKCLVGFEAVPVAAAQFRNCRGEVGRKAGNLQVGMLSAVFNEMA